MSSRTRGNILIVDDEGSVRDTYSVNLESAGFEVRTAANGGEALVELGPSADVLLDRRMPGMSGEEVLEHIREWETHCRVVMVTAIDPGPDILDMQFDDYLMKPVTREELVDVVDQLLSFDCYEDLLAKYHSVVRKYAVLRSHVQKPKVEGSDALAELEERRESLHEQLSEVVDEFTDDEVASVFREMHAPH